MMRKWLNTSNTCLNINGLYRKADYRKYNEFKKYLDEDPEGYVCVMFPEARFIKTKKGRFEFALLLQQCMLKKRNSITRTSTKRTQ